MNEYVIIAIFGAIVAIDTTVAGQFMIAQPIVTCTLAGYFLGYPEPGVVIGCIMQLIWLKMIPAGGSVYLNGNFGSLTAVSTLAVASTGNDIPDEALLFTVIIYGIISSYIFGLLTAFKRRFNLTLQTYAHRAIVNGSLGKFQTIHLAGVAYTGIAGGLGVVAFTICGSAIIRSFPGQFYEITGSFAPIGTYALFGIGIGTVLSMAWDRRAWYYPLAGILLGCLILILF